MSAEHNQDDRRAVSVTPIVLAGGGSERFGPEPKSLATVQGQPMIARIVDAVRAATGRTPVVAVGDPEKQSVVDPALSPPVRYRYDVEWGRGPLAGIAGAISAVETDAVFVCGCDMPQLDPTAVEWLVDEYARRPADAIIPADDAGHHPLHAVYDTQALQRYCSQQPSDLRLQRLVSELNATVVQDQDAPDRVPLNRSVSNTNTRAELCAARTRIGD
ncbi:molybdenum cofactor guanylyltransferase [Halorubrum tropicale]|jgi:molybdopterin-guanine dinucleotide biosynthesis protein A|uniref:Probable molybdenum cofactor guanylyltransferase n=1 Tax=Halorubrum tropicale TaxID=1765655 RepID=A0A0N0UA94_9EURY|nr:molybdenum cofactor guanylyltransferase [Halorubrum tropicale]KOX95753.1 molybdopterin-guanine dinucleotide biosynthesis protein MobA [Halorubrum tropicale]